MCGKKTHEGSILAVDYRPAIVGPVSMLFICLPAFFQVTISEL